MKTRTLLHIAMMSLALVSSAFAVDDKLEGTVSLTGKLADIDGNEAKFNEYRHIKDGADAYTDIRLGYEKGAYYVRATASDIGYDTQKYQLDGGMWGRFKYDLFYSEIPHNFTYGAKTFYSGAGTSNLTGPPNTNVSSWNTFDYSIDRKSYGGGLRFDLMKPFFLSLSATREERTGIKPTAASTGSPGGGFVELPEPVDYTTNTFAAEVGYAKKPYFASLSYSYVDFNNDNEIMSFQHPVSGTPDVLTLPPGNQYYKVAFKGAVDLPLKSRFTVNLSNARAKSDANLVTSYVFEGVPTTITLSDLVFNGKIDTQSYSFALTGDPVPFVHGKIFYKYYEKENKSDRVTTTQDTDTFTNKLFDYHKNKAGVELGIKLPANFYLIPAYTYVRTNRAREDLPETRDNIYSIDLRWTGLPFLTAKVGYERLERNANHGILTLTTGEQAEADSIEQYVRRYDAAPKDQDTYRASVEIYPMDNLGFSVGFRYIKADYTDTVLGLRDEKGSELTMDADYSLKNRAKLNAYFAYERTKTYQVQRRFNPPSLGGDPNPNGTQNATNFNWDVSQVNNSYDYGAGIDVYLMPRKLTLRLQLDYLDSDGHADFAYYTASALTGGRNNDNIDSTIWDDYRKTALLAKATYQATGKLSVSAGYAYEHYRYNDATLDGYQYTFGTGATTNYLTGAYKDPSYHANIVFATIAYRF